MGGRVLGVGVGVTLRDFASAGEPLRVIARVESRSVVRSLRRNPRIITDRGVMLAKTMFDGQKAKSERIPPAGRQASGFGT